MRRLVAATGQRNGFGTLEALEIVQMNANDLDLDLDGGTRERRSYSHEGQEGLLGNWFLLSGLLTPPPTHPFTIHKAQ